MQTCATNTTGETSAPCWGERTSDFQFDEDICICRHTEFPPLHRLSRHRRSLAFCNPLIPGVRITVSVRDTMYNIDLTFLVVRLS